MVLVDPENTSLIRKQSIALTVGHELAHVSNLNFFLVEFTLNVSILAMVWQSRNNGVVD
jgi:hypothetical protein